MKRVWVLVWALLLCCASGGLAETPVERTETPAQRDARMKWFQEARFGMFIHWGVYSVAGGEWKGRRARGGGQEWLKHNENIPTAEYAPLLGQFNPVKYDPDAWVKMARDAGMKYIVITSKHHDGFCLWPTKLNDDWNVAATPCKKDLLGPLAAACKKYGVRFCTYHSILDWHHPLYEGKETGADGRSMDRYFHGYLLPQMAEIMKAYHPGIMWFDGEWDSSWTAARGEELERYLRELDPGIIINNRVGKARHGMAGMNKGGQKAGGDYGTPEQNIPAGGFGKGVYWESCMTMNGTWGYSKYDQGWKSATTLIRNLVDCASKGGNYLLNVGPTGEGEIPQASVERLAEIGKWMKVNGEAIHGTSATPFSKSFAWGRVTAKDNTLYLHVFTLPPEGKLVLPLKNRVKRATWLAGGAKAGAVVDAGGITVSLPAALPDAADSVLKLTLKETPAPL